MMPNNLRVCAALSVVLVIGACSDERVRQQNVSDAADARRASDLFLITVDTLRADHMSLYGYSRETTPELDLFFSKGRVYRRAYATSSYTSPSVVSILTGLWPFHHGVRRFMQVIPESLDTLATRLSAKGYDSGGFVSNYVLRGGKTGFARGFETFDDDLPEKEAFRDEYERSAIPTTEAAQTWLEQRRNSDRPLFLWVHYIDPHGPYAPPHPKVREFSHDAPEPMDPAAIPEYQRYPGLTDALEYVDLYDEEIAHVDRSIGHLLDSISKLDRDRPWLVAFTSDHGEALTERPQRFQHSQHVWEELIAVPLALRGTGIEPGSVSEPVSIVDIAPTLLVAAGLPLPEGLDGLPLTSAPERRAIYSESYPPEQEPVTFMWRAARLGDEKWVLAPSRHRQAKGFRIESSNPFPEKLTPFPNTPESPEAFRDLFKLHASEVKALQSNRNRPASKTEAARLSDKDRAALKALGYVE
jgi:arylsulfatase A-like enzyme